jgi:hypothetical protein
MRDVRSGDPPAIAQRQADALGLAIDVLHPLAEPGAARLVS